MNVAHLLIRQASKHPDRTALIEGSGARANRITFGDLDARSALAATRLAADGIGTGDHVLIFLPMSIDLYVALIAVFRIGAVATFLDPSASRRHIAQCCDIAKPSAFIGTFKAHLLRMTSPALRRIPRRYTTGWPVPGADRWKATRIDGKIADIVERSDADAALLTFTSGSTGMPKAAMRSHGFLASQHAALEEAIALRDGEVDLATLPIFALANIASGVTTLIAEGNLRRPGFVKTSPILRQCAIERATRSTASPAFFERLLEDPTSAGAMAHFRQIYTGGAPVFPGLLERLQAAMPQARVVAVYGSTEAEPIAHVAWDEVSAEDTAAMFTGAGLLAGTPVSQVQLRIIPNTWGSRIMPLGPGILEAMQLPAGEAGEIVVHGEHVLTGYLHGIGDEQTKFRVGTDIWHRTGDAGYLDTRGRLWLLGRAEAQIVDDRGTIHPFAVECAASRMASVRRSALLSHGGKRVLVVQPADRFSSDDSARVKSELPWALLDDVLAVRAIPVDKRHNAKIDYPQLRKMLLKLRPPA